MNWLRGNTNNVYRVFNTNHSKSYLVNKNSLFKYIQSNRVPSLSKLNNLIARILNDPEVRYTRYRLQKGNHGTLGPNLLFTEQNRIPYNRGRGPGSFERETANLANYFFNKPGNKKRQATRDPVYGKNLLLKNIEVYKLTENNKKQLANKKAENAKKNANERAAMLERARKNARERNRARRQQNVRASGAKPNFLWYHTIYDTITNANGQSHGQLNIEHPYSTPININNTIYQAISPRLLRPNQRAVRQEFLNRFGWPANRTVMYIRANYLASQLRRALNST